MPFLVTLIILSLGGLLESVYLVYKHYARKPLVCPINHDCSRVFESKWGNLLGVRNEFLGLIFYIAIFVFAVGEAVFPELTRPFYSLAFWGTALGSLFSLFLLSIQAFVIKDYCFYCLILAAITFLTFINVFAIPH